MQNLLTGSQPLLNYPHHGEDEMGNSRSFAYRAQVIKISLAPSPFPIASSLRTTMLSAKSRTVLVSVLVSQSRCDKSPQTRWLETAAVGFLTVPEARGSTSRCRLAGSGPAGHCEGSAAPVSGGGLPSVVCLACSRAPPVSALVITWPFPWVSGSSFPL